MIEVLYLADSRGFSIDAQAKIILEGDNFIRLHVVPVSGGTISQVVEAGLLYAGNRKFDQVYLHAGINNLTCKLGYREVTPIFNNWSLMVRYMMIQFYEARASLHRIADTIIMCELVGMHFGLYNRSTKCYLPQQVILNRGVMRINEYITDMNRQAGIYSPYFCGLTHKMKGTTKLHHRYVQTTHDGLHFNKMTALKLAEYLIQNICDIYLDINA